MSSSPTVSDLSDAGARLRPAEPGDLDRLLALENEAFDADRISWRSLKALLASRGAFLFVADAGRDVPLLVYAAIRGGPQAALAAPGGS